MTDVVPLRDETGSWVAGGEIKHGSTEFWGIEATSAGSRAHFWKRAPTGYRRECDGAMAPAFLGNGQSSMFGAGNFPKCKRCMKRLIGRPDQNKNRTGMGE